MEFTTWLPVSAVPKLVCAVFVDSRRVKRKEALLFGFYVDLALNTSLHQQLVEKPSGLHTGLLRGEKRDTLLPDTQQLQAHSSPSPLSPTLE